MKMNLEKLSERIIEGGDIIIEEALELANLHGSALYPLFGAASRIKEHFVGDKVFLCSIVNAKSGRCPENCSFCAQSAHHKTDAPVYSLIDEERMVACAREAEKNGSSCYGIITSGTSIKKGEELERICNAVRRIRRETGITPSCSLVLSIMKQHLPLLKRAWKPTITTLKLPAAFSPTSAPPTTMKKM